MAIVEDDIDNYLENLLPQRDEILVEMERYAAEHNFPIVGPQVGQILRQYTHLINPTRIFEFGSGYGYSAMWFARASEDDCDIFCTDMSEENAEMANRYFNRAKVSHKINFLIDDAVSAFNRTEGNFDILYCDINKDGYPEVFRNAIPRLNQGGVLITDNTLWSGRVVENNPSQSTKGIIEYNRLAYNHPELLTTLYPVRDGVSVSLKL